MIDNVTTEYVAISEFMSLDGDFFCLLVADIPKACGVVRKNLEQIFSPQGLRQVNKNGTVIMQANLEKMQMLNEKEFKAFPKKVSALRANNTDILAPRGLYK